MVWSFSFHLMPGEEIVDDSTQGAQQGKIRPAYSVFLTNKRVMFRFDSLGSSLTQSFSYNEIIDAKPFTKLFIKYLRVETSLKDYLLHVADAESWSRKVLDMKENVKNLPEIPKLPDMASAEEMKKRDLLDMLTVLKGNSLLTDEEFNEKARILDSHQIR